MTVQAPGAPQPAETMRDRFVRVTDHLLDDDPRLALVLADISVSAFEDTARRHPARVVNVGIREQLMISVAGGMALAGLRPIAHSYAPFLVERPFEQVKLDFGHQGVGGILVSVGASYDWASGGRTHEAPEDVALVSTLPGWEIAVPGHPDEAEALFREAAAGSGCVYLRLTEDGNAAPMPGEPGRMRVVRRGEQATVVAVGPVLDRVLQATADLDVTVLYATTVRPFDAVTLRTVAVPERVPTVVLVEPYLAGTSSAPVADALSDRPHRLIALGVPRTEHRRYGSARDHDAAHGLDAAGIRSRIASALS